MKLRNRIFVGILGFFAVATGVMAVTLSHTKSCEPWSEPADSTATMRAIVYNCYGAPDVLEFTKVAKPSPGPNEVLVKVMTAAVNPLDWHYMRGEPYFMRLGSGIGKPTDTRMGVDFAGVVDAIGAQVTEFDVGDEVFGGRSGAFAEYVLVPEDRAIAHKPANVSFEQAAAMPIAAITALQALRDIGGLQSGQKVLINGASGGVGTFAVQIAKAMGAEVSGVCSTRNVDMVRSIGADHVFDYKNEDYTESDAEFDLIIDNVGNHSLGKNRKVMAESGKLVIVGGPPGRWLGPLMRPLAAVVYGPFVDQEFEMILASMRQEDLVVLAEMMSSGEVISVIDRRYSLAEVPAAIAYSESGRARGKIIVNVARPKSLQE